jgi:hypothetical protein
VDGNARPIAWRDDLCRHLDPGSPPPEILEQIKMIGPDVHHLAPFGMPAIASIPIG